MDTWSTSSPPFSREKFQFNIVPKVATSKNFYSNINHENNVTYSFIQNRRIREKFNSRNNVF